MVKSKYYKSSNNKGPGVGRHTLTAGEITILIEAANQRIALLEIASLKEKGLMLSVWSDIRVKLEAMRQ